MRLTPEALRALELFHATPVASLLRPRRIARPAVSGSWPAVEARYREAFAVEAESLRLARIRGQLHWPAVGRPRTVPESGPWVCRNGHVWADVTAGTYAHRGHRVCRRCANAATIRSLKKQRQREAAARSAAREAPARRRAGGAR